MRTIFHSVKLTFIDRDGDESTVDGKVGDTLLEVAKEYDIDLEGACEGTLSCSTCHLIVDPEWYAKIPDPITEEEEDMLDMAYGLTDT
jgi:2Fe-2S ferredoxin